MSSIVRFVLVATLLSATAGFARAQDATVFVRCDGYGAPSPSGDGMTKPAFTFGFFAPDLQEGGDTSQQGVVMGAAGVQACAEALSHRRLTTDYAARRASLLRARALHHLALAEPAAALENLERADAAAPRDVFQARSFGLGSALVRAYALRMAGRTQEGEALALATARSRPFDRQTAAAARIALGAAAGRDAVTEILRAMARLHPGDMEALLRDRFDQGRFEEVARLHGQLVPPELYEALGTATAPRLQQRRQSFQAIAAAERAGRYAFVLQRLGHSSEADAALAAAREALANAAVAVPPKPGRDDPHGDLQRDLNSETEMKGAASLDRWTVMIERLRMATANPGAVLASGAGALPVAGRAAAEVREAARLALPIAEQAAAPSFTLAFERELAAAPDDYAATAGLLLRTLPAVEASDRSPAYRRLGLLAQNGVSEQTLDHGGVYAYARYDVGTSSNIPELVVLGLAHMAEAAGHKAVVVTNRLDIRNIEVEGSPAAPIRETPDGYMIFMWADLVDPAADPERAWRALEAAEVRAALEPIYGAPR